MKEVSELSEVSGSQMIKSIYEKINQMIILQRKVWIVTKADVIYPKGKHHNGYIIDVRPEKALIIFNDDKNGMISININNIESPEYIKESRK